MPLLGVCELSEATQGQTFALHNAGYSYQAIGSNLGVAPSTAWKTIQHHHTHNTFTSLPCSGCPPLRSGQTHGRIIWKLQAHRFDNYHRIAQLVGGVTECQVQHMAYKADYHQQVASRKPYIGPEHAKKQLQWAWDNAKTDWDSVIWADESSINTGKHSGRQLVTQKPKEALLPGCIQPTFPSGHKSLMVWACIANGQKGPIIQLEAKPSTSTKKNQKGGGGINAEIYANQVILGPLKDFWMELKKEQGREVFVVEDGAPTHKGKTAQAAHKAVGICQLSHPPSSPDLNPIEPIWHLLKK
jgi:hypothetical protein